MTGKDLLEDSIQRHHEIVNKTKANPTDEDYKNAQKYNTTIELLDSINYGIIVVVDYYKNEYLYASNKFDPQLGFHTNNLINNTHKWYRERLHKEDYTVNIAGIEGRKYIQSQPIEKRKDFKLIQNFRLLNDSNEWVQVTMQDNILELDSDGNIWLVLKILDLAPIQDTSISAKSTLQNTKTGEVIFTMQKDDKINISKREKEILSYIAKGHRSKEISEQLFISVNTVNNHRRNIISKLNVSNSVEAITLAQKLGII